MKIGIGLLLGLFIVVGTADAVLIASESFYTTDRSVGSYKNGTSFGGATRANIEGTVGFTAVNSWLQSCGIISPSKWYANDHSAMVGASLPGAATIWKGSSAATEISVRQIGATPTASASYYFSGTLRPVDTTGMIDGEFRSMGMSGASTSDHVANIAAGMHYGVRQVGAQVYLAAFAGGNSYNLLDITGVSGSSLYQVVLQLDVDVSGNEIFSAGYALHNATELTSVVSGVSIEIWSSPSDLEYLWLQRKVGTSTGADTEVVFDEARLGTTLGDVTTYSVIP